MFYVSSISRTHPQRVCKRVLFKTDVSTSAAQLNCHHRWQRQYLGAERETEIIAIQKPFASLSSVFES